VEKTVVVPPQIERTLTQTEVPLRKETVSTPLLKETVSEVAKKLKKIK
jgi:hypothetical protein